MHINLLTHEDLLAFKKDLIEEIKQLVEPNLQRKEWLKSKDVCEMLNISPSTLQNLRIAGKLPFKKVMGTVFYNIKDVEGMLNVI